ncbi:hypothetical protein OG799_07825 [Micromonospora sp. NBC_00898]|uniref:hypothetical protein n=1 Tax=Micromonospora sp. NBC_00898 TaxID=2975981 RepID=UPI00386D2C27|nr:hypothetical protein OG799_07825 [Micromonospora sp. NBC_00898]
MFPGENYRAPRNWTEQAYRQLSYVNEVDKGGHFAAREEPELCTAWVAAISRHTEQMIRAVRRAG